MRASSAPQTRLTLRERHATFVVASLAQLAHTSSSLCMNGVEHNSMSEIASSQPHRRFIFIAPLPPAVLVTPVVAEPAGRLHIKHTRQGET